MFSIYYGLKPEFLGMAYFCTTAWRHVAWLFMRPFPLFQLTKAPSFPRSSHTTLNLNHNVEIHYPPHIYLLITERTPFCCSLLADV